MTTSLQNRALGKGLATAVQRNKERATATITINYDPRFAIYQILSLIKHALFVLGGLNPANTTIEIDDGSADLRAAFVKSQAEKKDLQIRLTAALKTQHDELISEAQRWVSVVRAAEILGIHKQKIYRAINEGRIVFQGDRGRRRSNLRVDPATYKPKERQSAQPRRKSKKSK